MFLVRAQYYTSRADLIFSGLAVATRITTKGQVTLSKKARAALHVARVLAMSLDSTPSNP